MTPEVNTEEQKQAPEAQAKHGLKDFSVKAAGFGTLVADAALIARGRLHGDSAFSKAGIYGLTAGTVGAVWGNPSAEKQLRQMHHKLGQYLKKEGVTIPETPTNKELTREHGLIDHIDTFLSSYPTQVMNVLYAMIGGAFIQQGKKEKVRDLKISGTMLIIGALAGLLIDEKKPDPKHPPKGAIEKGWSWIQEKPLRLTGTLLNVNQYLLAKNAWNERKADPTSNKHIYKFIAVAGFTFGNIMLMLSSTSHGGSDKKMDPKIMNDLADTSARVIAAQPKETQETLLEHVSGYLASQPNMKMKAADISDILHKKLAEITAQPQVAGGWAERTLASSGQGSAPAL